MDDLRIELRTICWTPLPIRNQSIISTNRYEPITAQLSKLNCTTNTQRPMTMMHWVSVLLQHMQRLTIWILFKLFQTFFMNSKMITNFKNKIHYANWWKFTFIDGVKSHIHMRKTMKLNEHSRVGTCGYLMLLWSRTQSTSMLKFRLKAASYKSKHLPCERMPLERQRQRYKERGRTSSDRSIHVETCQSVLKYTHHQQQTQARHLKAPCMKSFTGTVY